MTCTQTQKMISAYMDKELSGIEMQIIGQHLRQCPDCATEYQQMLAMKRMMARLQGPAPTADFELKLFAAVSQSPQTSSHHQQFWAKWFTPSKMMRPALALCGVFMAVLGYQLTHRSSYVTVALKLNNEIETPRQIDLSRLQNEAEEIKQRWTGLDHTYHNWKLIRPENEWRGSSSNANIKPVSFVSYSD